MMPRSESQWDPVRSRRLDVLAEEMRSLLRMAPRSVRRRFVLPCARDTEAEAVARLLYQQRRERAACFGDHATVFAEPAWDLLLDLFVARSEKRTVSASAACIGACAPPTTALRCIASLEARGLIATRRHPTDGRMRLVEMTATGVSLMRKCLDPAA